MGKLSKEEREAAKSAAAEAELMGGSATPKAGKPTKDKKRKAEADTPASGGKKDKTSKGEGRRGCKPAPVAQLGGRT